ncbi:branched-chain amino acid ABC transporter permease [Amorphus sp. 3PC139-8]|uniref:branched-chain amino acid ABC transporter permease n=1 Tax=Amorphus sp. 3PC139-8 TaxID=2735676 RepID=UPI00345C7C86
MATEAPAAVRQQARTPSGSGRSLARATLGGIVIALPVLVLAAVILWFAPTYYVRLATVALVNLIIVVGLQTFMGNSNTAHLGHSAFVAIGAYAVAILATPLNMKKLSIPDAPFGLSHVVLDPVVAGAVALLVVGVLAAVTGRIIARLSGIAATIVSLAFLIVTHSTILNWTDLFKGNQGFFGIPRVVDIYWMLAFATLSIVAARIFKDSKYGLQLRASAQSPQAAAAFGVNAKGLRFGAWILSGLICGLAGILYAYFVGTISPRVFYFHQVMMTLAMLILGGMGTVTGAVTGVIALSVLLEFIRGIESGVTVAGIQLPQVLGLSGVALGAVIVLSMAFRPDGIAGRYELDEQIARLFSRRPPASDPSTATVEASRELL